MIPWDTLLDMAIGGVAVFVCYVIIEGREAWLRGRTVSAETMRILRESRRKG